MAKKTSRPRLYANARDRKRAQRAREAVSLAHQVFAAEPVVPVVDHADPVGVLAAWAASTLVVPPGHPRAGEPMALPDFAVDWLRESWDAHESALSTARKNAKSAICAVLALGFLVGPLRRPGWRGAIASLSKEKAGELRKQVAQIAEASGLAVKIRRSPYPGMIESATGSLDTLSADRAAGHASGYDLCLVDETGLFPLRARELLAGLRSSVSARNGKIRHISIRGDSILFREILDNPSTAAAVTLVNQSPVRIAGQLEVRVEDLAVMPSLEAALSESLQGSMSNELDEQVFNGGSGDLNGLFTQAANVNAAGSAETFATGIARFASLVDGRHAYDLSDVRAVIENNIDEAKALQLVGWSA